MKRTTMFLDAALEQDLKRYAERQGRSVASVAREALAMWVDAQRALPAVRPGFVAAGRSGRTDTAERHEALVFARLAPHGASSPSPAGGPGRGSPRPRRRSSR